MLAVSPATIDRLLMPVRVTASRRTKRRPATKPSKQVPIRTFADWTDPEPGFLEIDFVSHGGSSMQGVFLWSLVATDVCSGWTQMIPLIAREQSLVVEGLTVLGRQFPMAIRGIDSDNDSAFINETLLAWYLTSATRLSSRNGMWQDRRGGEASLARLPTPHRSWVRRRGSSTAISNGHPGLAPVFASTSSVGTRSSSRSL